MQYDLTMIEVPGNVRGLQKTSRGIFFSRGREICRLVPETLSIEVVADEPSFWPYNWFMSEQGVWFTPEKRPDAARDNQVAFLDVFGLGVEQRQWEFDGDVYLSAVAGCFAFVNVYRLVDDREERGLKRWVRLDVETGSVVTCEPLPGLRFDAATPSGVLGSFDAQPSGAKWVVAYDCQGNKRWTAPTPLCEGPAYCWATVVEDVVVYKGAQERIGQSTPRAFFIWALDLATGAERWRHQCDAVFDRGRPYCENGRVYTRIGCDLVIMDVRTGEILQRRSMYRHQSASDCYGGIRPARENVLLLGGDALVFDATGTELLQRIGPPKSNSPFAFEGYWPALPEEPVKWGEGWVIPLRCSHQLHAFGVLTPARGTPVVSTPQRLPVEFSNVEEERKDYAMRVTMVMGTFEPILLQAELYVWEILIAKGYQGSQYHDRRFNGHVILEIKRSLIPAGGRERLERMAARVREDVKTLSPHIDNRKRAKITIVEID